MKFSIVTSNLRRKLWGESTEVSVGFHPQFLLLSLNALYLPPKAYLFPEFPLKGDLRD
jgi:hypothetical protein